MSEIDESGATPTDNQDSAKTVGRGFLVITAAKLWFMVGGVAINFGLPYIFGSSIYGGDGDGKALYGQYIDLNNTLSILSMVMVTGVMQTVAKFVAERPDSSGGLVKQAFKMMVVLSTLIGGGFILAAPWIAEARSNPELVMGYRAAGVILFSYGLYTVFIGTLNGRKLFFRQALYDIGFTSIKSLLVLGFALLGFGVVGAFSGFAVAAVIIMAMAAWRVGRDLGTGPTDKRLYAFAASVMLYTLVFNLVFKLDVLMLKPYAVALLGEGDAVDSLIGVYGLGLNISRIPWQATIAITFVVFPMVSEATFAQDRERTMLYIRQTLRYSMLLVGIPAVVLAAVPHAVVGLLPEGFSDASVALAWLAPAYFCFSLFNVTNTLLMSAGRATAVLVIGCITAALAAGLYAVFLPGAVDGLDLIARTGMITLAAFTVGLMLGMGMIAKLYGPPIPIATVIRVLCLGVGLVVLGRYLPATGKILSLVIACAVALAFIIGLVVLREFGAEDKARLMGIFRRGKKA